MANQTETSLWDFQSFGKIPRLNRDMIVTEKIDGTNAQISILKVDATAAVTPPETWASLPGVNSVVRIDDNYVWVIRTGSRNKWITPKDDNYGFAKWVQANAESLVGLGEGRHYGEWWGQGVQRGYGLMEKRFSLFNVSRWGDDTVRPSCCHVVPTLFEGPFSTDDVGAAVEGLRSGGSLAAPGFTRPEGVIVFQVASGGYVKVTLEKDEKPKSQVVD